MDHQSVAQLLGSYGEFVGALAVVITLIYLTKQIKQSNTASETAAIQAFFDSTQSLTRGLHSNGDLIRRGIADWSSLTPDQQNDLSSIFLDWASKIHMGYRLYLRRVIDDQTYTSWESTFLSILKTRGGAAWWVHAQAFWPQDFQTRVRRMLSEEGADIASWDEVMPWYGSSTEAPG